MRQIITLCIALLVAGASSAEEPVSPMEFRAYSEGWTLYFELNGRPFGSERFEEGGRARWRYNDGSCVRGAWKPHGAQLCFLYEAEAAERDLLCWRMLRDDQGLFARLLTGDNAGLELRVVRRDREPLLCGKPGTAT